MDKKVIKACYDKYNNKIESSWAELANILQVTEDDPYGEKLRQKFKAYRKKQGDLSDVATRILHISDLHYPYNLPINIFKDYKNKIDILIINGDEQDCKSISRFRKKKRSHFMDELIGTRQMLIDIIKLIKPKKVFLNYGNHNLRLENFIADKLDDDVGELLPSTNLDYIIEDGFTRYDKESGKKKKYTPLKDEFKDIDVVYTNNWYCQVGKAIFAHPQAYRRSILGTSAKAFEYFCQERLDFDTLVLAHTHQLGLVKYGKCYLFESGALCKQMDYMKMSLVKPQSQGFLYLAQDKDGNLIYDKCKLVAL